MTFQKPIIFALTGGIACGKSEAGRILSAEGVSVLDTDQLAHELMRAGHEVYEQIVERFGRSVVGADGEINRAVLGSIVFADAKAREMLNGLVHPAVIAAAEQWKSVQSGDAVVLVPLLFEANWTEKWNAIVCVSADEAVVFQRLKQRGLTLEESRQRIAAQMPLSQKEKKSNFVIKNNQTLDEFRSQIVRVLETIRIRENTHE